LLLQSACHAPPMKAGHPVIMVSRLMDKISPVRIESERRLYSITSSARNRNDSGIVRPIASAAFRLMTSLKYVGACTGRSPGFFTLENPIDIRCRLPKYDDGIDPIRH
jgi:hypothetical protein